MKQQTRREILGATAALTVIGGAADQGDAVLLRRAAEVRGVVEAAATQFAVVYETNSKTIRRIVEPDSDDHFARMHLAADERMVILPLAEHQVRTVATLTAHIPAE